MQSAVDVPGSYCHMTCRRGALSIITSGLGAATGHGKRFTTISAAGCGTQQVDIRNPVVRSSTASQYRLLNKVEYEATMPRRTCLGANATFWSIRLVSCCWL